MEEGNLLRITRFKDPCDNDDAGDGGMKLLGLTDNVIRNF